MPTEPPLPSAGRPAVLPSAARVAAQPVRHPRGVERLVTGRATSDGAGVKLTRVLTHDLQRRLDPFLMLDAFGSDDPGEYIAGFPDHPHRGFETVTYMIAGRMRHRDSPGNEGLLENGGVQWTSDPHRPGTGIHEPRHGPLGLRQGNRSEAHRRGQTDPERLHRELQRQIP